MLSTSDAFEELRIILASTDRVKPSDETLKQGRNLDHGKLYSPTLTLTLTHTLTLTPSPLFKSELPLPGDFVQWRCPLDESSTTVQRIDCLSCA